MEVSCLIVVSIQQVTVLIQVADIHEVTLGERREGGGGGGGGRVRERGDFSDVNLITNCT